MARKREVSSSRENNEAGDTVSSEAAESFQVPGCLSCGACCFSTVSDYVPVTGKDWTRLGAEAERWALFGRNRAFMRMQGGHCAALQLQQPTAGGGAGAFVCSIYLTRPQVCRDLARGSGECHGEWTLKRATAAAALSRIGP